MKVKIKARDLVGLLTKDISSEKFMSKYDLDRDKVSKIEKKLKNSKWRID